MKIEVIWAQNSKSGMATATSKYGDEVILLSNRRIGSRSRLLVGTNPKKQETTLLPLPSERVDLSTFAFPVTSTSQITVKPRLKGELVVGVVDDQTGRTNWLTPSGAPVAPLTAEQAIAIVWDKTDIAADVTEWVTSAPQAAEYRGRQLPLWRAYDVDEPSLRVYVDPRSGDIIAIRNTAWRAWDFLWMLHIMDYDDRDDIGTWLLKLFSVMALLTAIAGIGLYLMIPWRRSSS